jgi:hypothetical protein
MEAWVVGLVVLACTLGGAVIGMGLRRWLPEHHLRDDSKDVVRLGMGLVATMTALILGLLVASAKSTYDAQKDGLDQISANLILLDVMLTQYGPEAEPARHQLRIVVDNAVKRLWPTDGAQRSTAAPDSAEGGMIFHSLLLGLHPADERQRVLLAQAVQISMDLARTRWLMAAAEESPVIPQPFVAILLVWLVILFASFGLFAPRNATVMAMTGLSGLSVAGATFLTVEMARPFEGLMQLSKAPLGHALAQLAP